MTSKTAKDIIIGKWGLKSGSSRPENELEKYKQENAALRKSLEEFVKGKSKMADPERNGLLEVGWMFVLELTCVMSEPCMVNVSLSMSDFVSKMLVFPLKT